MFIGWAIEIEIEIEISPPTHEDVLKDIHQENDDQHFGACSQRCFASSSSWMLRSGQWSITTQCAAKCPYIPKTVSTSSPFSRVNLPFIPTNRS